MSGDALKVLIADDQELVRAGFRLILERAGFRVVGEAENGRVAVEAAARLAPDVVLMDVRMPELDGIEATRAIAATGELPRIVVLTTFDLDEYVYEAVRAGASGFLLKDVPPDDLVHAVRVVARGEAMLAPVITSRMLQRFATGHERHVALPDLTEREAEIARLVAKGQTNAEIGARLFLSDATVKTYVSRLLSKLGLRDRVQLAALAYESGLVRVGGP
jgi:DNA-binding NarL/FixJ family response regulator